jgi:hypothetical protein
MQLGTSRAFELVAPAERACADRWRGGAGASPAREPKFVDRRDVGTSSALEMVAPAERACGDRWRGGAGFPREP